jgi:hypothetical protein
MRIVRDDITVALDDLVILCLESSEVYRSAAAALEDDRMAAALASMADDRAEAAAFLAEEVRRRGDAPDTEPTEERVILEKAVVQLTAMAPGKSGRDLLDRCLEQEKKILGCVGKALALPVEGLVRERLEQLRRDVTSRLDSP